MKNHDQYRFQTNTSSSDDNCEIIDFCAYKADHPRSHTRDYERMDAEQIEILIFIASNTDDDYSPDGAA